jgi:hypothetical protein
MVRDGQVTVESESNLPDGFIVITGHEEPGGQASIQVERRTPSKQLVNAAQNYRSFSEPFVDPHKEQDRWDDNTERAERRSGR